LRAFRVLLVPVLLHECDFKPVLSPLPVRHHALEKATKLGAVIRVDQMTQLVDDHVVAAVARRANEVGVQGQCAGVRQTAPARAHPSQPQRGRFKPGERETLPAFCHALRRPARTTTRSSTASDATDGAGVTRAHRHPEGDRYPASVRKFRPRRPRPRPPGIHGRDRRRVDPAHGPAVWRCWNDRALAPADAPEYVEAARAAMAGFGVAA
jgi:hypothetical protein